MGDGEQIQSPFRGYWNGRSCGGNEGQVPTVQDRIRSSSSASDDGQRTDAPRSRVMNSTDFLKLASLVKPELIEKTAKALAALELVSPEHANELKAEMD